MSSLSLWPIERLEQACMCGTEHLPPGPAQFDCCVSASGPSLTSFPGCSLWGLTQIGGKQWMGRSDLCMANLSSLRAQTQVQFLWVLLAIQNAHGQKKTASRWHLCVPMNRFSRRVRRSIFIGCEPALMSDTVLRVQPVVLITSDFRITLGS